MNILPTINEQYLTSNQHLFTLMLISFREVNRTYNNNLILSLDNNNWIIFDNRVCRDIFTISFKKFNELTDFLKRLNRDITNVGTMQYRKHPKQSDTWSLKSLSKIYNESELQYFINP